MVCPGVKIHGWKILQDLILLRLLRKYLHDRPLCSPIIPQRLSPGPQGSPSLPHGHKWKSGIYQQVLLLLLHDQNVHGSEGLPPVLLRFFSICFSINCAWSPRVYHKKFSCLMIYQKIAVGADRLQYIVILLSVLS